MPFACYTLYHEEMDKQRCAIMALSLSYRSIECKHCENPQNTTNKWEKTKYATLSQQLGLSRSCLGSAVDPPLHAAPLHTHVKVHKYLPILTTCCLRCFNNNDCLTRSLYMGIAVIQQRLHLYLRVFDIFVCIWIELMNSV